MMDSAAVERQAVGYHRDRDGERWLVVVRRPAPDRFLVGEISPQGEWRLIEELCGEQESEGTAIAVARDYLEQQRRHASQ
jgi:hypothetical protein